MTPNDNGLLSDIAQRMTRVESYLLSLVESVNKPDPAVGRLDDRLRAVEAEQAGTRGSLRTLRWLFGALVGLVGAIAAVLAVTHG